MWVLIRVENGVSWMVDRLDPPEPPEVERPVETIAVRDMSGNVVEIPFRGPPTWWELRDGPRDLRPEWMAHPDATWVKRFTITSGPDPVPGRVVPLVPTSHED